MAYYVAVTTECADKKIAANENAFRGTVKSTAERATDNIVDNIVDSASDSTVNKLVNATPCISHRILIADPDASHRVLIEEALADENVSIQIADTLDMLTHYMMEGAPDIVILDPALGNGNAFDTFANNCKEVRPRLMVCTEDKSTEMRVRCAAVGSDYLMYKPIVKEEIPLLINNLISRFGGEVLADQWQIDSLRWILHTPQGEKVSLVYREVIILSELSKLPGKGVSREVLISALGFNPNDYDVRRLESLVRRLRNKVEFETKQALPVNTVHGSGYAFTAPIRFMH